MSNDHELTRKEVGIINAALGIRAKVPILIGDEFSEDIQNLIMERTKERIEIVSKLNIIMRRFEIERAANS